MTRLQQLREEHGWSRAELARRSKLTPSIVGWTEDGRWKPYPVQLKKLGRALKADPNILLQEFRG